jgi:hypothetical protein
LLGEKFFIAAGSSVRDGEEFAKLRAGFRERNLRVLTQRTQREGRPSTSLRAGRDHGEREIALLRRAQKARTLARHKGAAPSKQIVWNRYFWRVCLPSMTRVMGSEPAAISNL